MRRLFSPTDAGDRTGLSLWGANLVALAITLRFGYALTLMASYWAEGCVIAFFHFLRMRAIARDRTGEEAEQARAISQAFALGFGVFHVAFWWPIPYYLIRIAPSYGLQVLAGVAAFTVHHWYSYRRNLAADRQGRPGWRAAAWVPLLRVAPLYIGVVLGGLAIGAILHTDSIPDAPLIVVVVLVKSVGDQITHRIEHNVLRRRAEVEAEVDATTAAEPNSE